MKKFPFLAAYFIIILLSFSNCVASEGECPPELPDDIDELLDPEFLGFDDPLPNQLTCIPTQTILNFITPPGPLSGFNAVTALSGDFYKRTTGPVTRRSLLDEPSLIPDHFCNNYWSFNFDVFYNYSPRMFFTKTSPFIRDYFFPSDVFLAELKKVNLSLVGLQNIDLDSILGLFSNIKLQQHRAGFMLGFGRQYQNFLITCRIPLYYLVEHFFLTDEEKRRIAQNPTLASFFGSDDAGEGTSESDEIEKFLTRHLASDKFGVGDTRLSVLGHFYNTPQHNLWVGFQLTLPTAKTFTKALLGGEFDPDAPIPPFNLQHFADLLQCAPQREAGLFVARTEGTAFLLDALDRLSTILVNAPMGNGKHFGLGPQLDYRTCFNEHFSAHTYLSMEAYFPHKESRFFLVDKSAEDFERDWRDPEQAGANLAVINRLIVSTLFPVGVRTVIWPGFKFQGYQTFMYKSKHWDGKIGFDYWFQAREKMTPLLPVIPCDFPLVTDKALRPAAQQGKIFGSVGYYDTLWDCIDWHISLNADGTVFHKGIGSNYTISIRAGLEF